MNKPAFLMSGLASVLTMMVMSQPSISAEPAPNLIFQPTYQPTKSLTIDEPLNNLPVIKSRGGKLKASMKMISAGITDKPLLYGGESLYSSNTNFPNASQSTGTQPSTSAYAYEIKAYGKTYPGSFPPPILQVQPGGELDFEITDELADGINSPSTSLFETNFHGHGLHVSPLSMGDNIYPIIQDPGTISEPMAMRVRIPIPKDQESGVDWFHPHRHLQTNPQVYGGLAGFLVVGDPMDPWPQYKANGRQPLKQQYLAFSEVNIQKTDPAGNTVDETGVNRLLVYGNYPGRGSPTSTKKPIDYWQKRINGQLNPVIIFRPGETQIFNMAAIGAFGSFNVAVTDGQLSEANPWPATLLVNDGNSSDPSKILGMDIKPYSLNLNADASRMRDQVAPTLLMPGNRLTMALTAPKVPGTYYLVDGWGGCNGPMSYVITPPATSPAPICNDVAIPGAPIAYTVLATLKVDGPEVKGPPPTFPVKGTNYDLFAAPPTHEAKFAFYIDNQAPANFLINNFTFPNGPLTQIQIGEIEEWSLYNQNVSLSSRPAVANHPFHIHQGNFIVTEIGGQKVDPHQVYQGAASGLNYVSPRDNVNIPAPIIPSAPNAAFTTPPSLAPTMKIKFRVDDFPGKYVFHCHILKHEDQGMMVPVLAYGPVKGLRAAFGGTPANQSQTLNVIDGSGGLSDVRQPFGPGFTGGINASSALGAAKFFSNYVAAQSNGGTQVVLYDGKKKNPVVRFKAFPAQSSGVSVALGDITGDGEPEIIVGSRAAGPARVRIFNAAGRLIRDYTNFMGLLAGDYPHGINVAAGDVNGDNFDDVVIGAGEGHPPVVIGLSGRDITAKKVPQTVLSFTAGGDPTAGARVAVGYVQPLTIPSYLPNVITTAESGPTTGRVEVWNPASLVPSSSMSGHSMADHPMVSLPSALLDSYVAFEGKADPVQLETGYVGQPGVPSIFAWSSPSHISRRSYSYTPPALASTPCPSSTTSPCPVINIQGSSKGQTSDLNF